MEVYMELSALNENHEYLRNFVGEWEVSTKGEWIMGGRFLKMHSKGSMSGQPFEDLQIIGYDNLQKYVSFWIDSTSTAFYFLSGTRDVSTNIITS